MPAELAALISTIERCSSTAESRPSMATEASTTPDSGTAWVRASLGLVVLAVLQEGDRHGYALAQRITELGLSPVRGGALYPVLGRLETEGAVEALWQAGEGGPGKKVYSITDLGRLRLVTARDRWHQFSVTLDSLLATTLKEQT
jgi:PadR family transcriptional regulator PadR